LTLSAPTKESPESTVLVEQNVAVTQGARSVTADRMHYRKSIDTAVFSGRATWKLEQNEGTADTLTLQPRTNVFEAAGHALVKLLRTGGAGSVLPAFPAKPGATNRAATPIDIAADNFSVRERRALFTGHVQAREAGTNGADSRLRCAELEVRFAANTNRAEGAVARGGVVMEQGRAGVTNGPNAYQRIEARTVTARMDATNGAIKELVAEKDVLIWVADAFAAGERMTYDVANDALQLEGDPFFINNVAMIYETLSLTVDRRTGSYKVQAPYKIIWFLKPDSIGAPLLPAGPKSK
jgi:lipopolysaccharide export system protein LptA